ncbi:MAG: DUF393 domain-containing protein [Aureliella sp.]
MEAVASRKETLASAEPIPAIEKGKRLEVFYDSECPLCNREIAVLRWMDRRDRVQFTDIASPEFDAANYKRADNEFVDEIQGRLADGQWITGVEVLRQLYAAVGFGLFMIPTRWPGISHALEWAYRIFARNRLKWTGRCNEHCSTDVS